MFSHMISAITYWNIKSGENWLSEQLNVGESCSSKWIFHFGITITFEVLEPEKIELQQGASWYHGRVSWRRWKQVLPDYDTMVVFHGEREVQDNQSRIVFYCSLTLILVLISYCSGEEGGWGAGGGHGPQWKSLGGGAEYVPPNI